jgi:hypothetical protein
VRIKIKRFVMVIRLVGPKESEALDLVWSGRGSLSRDLAIVDEARKVDALKINAN